jgi:hypothetical protein
MDGIQEIGAFETQGFASIHRGNISQGKSCANFLQSKSHIIFGIEITAQAEKGDGHQAFVR